MNLEQTIQQFKSNGINTLSTLSNDQLLQLLYHLDDLYFNNQPILSDSEYDIIKDYTLSINPFFNKIGHPSKHKVKLPFPMFSMNKIKPDTNSLSSWIEKYNSHSYIVSDKLDGISCLFTFTFNTHETKLFTRGNGTFGQNISHFIPHLILPNTSTLHHSITIRGELVMPNHTFETKYKHLYSNSRNLVAGIVNSNKINPIIQDIHFVCYEIIQPLLKPHDQLQLLNKLTLHTVLWQHHTSLSNDMLSNYLLESRKHSIYPIDGIIVTDNNTHNEPLDKNPDYSFAFKMVLTEQIAEAKVIDVIWTPSKDGYLKPRIHIETICIGGVNINYATGFNASFIQSNCIGIGSIIQIIRSGDVIPHVHSVVLPASQPKMPTEYNYIWNDTGIDILLVNKELDETVIIKNISKFFKEIGVESLGNGNVTKLVQSGFNTIPKIIHMTKQDFLSINGFKETMATKLFDGIHDKLTNSDLPTLMVASNIFGRGFSHNTIQLILSHYPTIIRDNNISHEQLNEIKGISDKTSQPFIQSIPSFQQFLSDCKLSHIINQDINKKHVSDVIENHPLHGKHIVLTSIKKKEIPIDQFICSGLIIDNTICKTTDYLIVKSLEDNTNKLKFAKIHSIPIFTIDQFINTFFKLV